MTWGGTALGNVAHTVSMVLNISSLMGGLLLLLLVLVSLYGSSPFEVEVVEVEEEENEDDVVVVPRERERPTPSLVPTRSALIGGEEGNDAA